jgi:hypothetical protein
MTVHIKRPNFNHILKRCPADLGTYRRPVGFVVDRGELGQVFFRVRRFALIHSFITDITVSYQLTSSNKNTLT